MGLFRRHPRRAQLVKAHGPPQILAEALTGIDGIDGIDTAYTYRSWAAAFQDEGAALVDPNQLGVVEVLGEAHGALLQNRLFLRLAGAMSTTGSS